MYGVVALVVITFQLICGVFAMSSLRRGYCRAIETKNAMCLAVKGLANSLDYGKSGSGFIAEGNLSGLGRQVPVDLERLLGEFNSILAENLDPSGISYYYASSASVKILVAGDRFFIADGSGKWSIPFFFCMDHGGRIVHLSAEGDHAWVYNENGAIEITEMSSLGIDSYTRHNLVNGLIYEIAGSYLESCMYADMYADAHVKKIISEIKPDTAPVSFHVLYPVQGMDPVCNIAYQAVSPCIHGYDPDCTRCIMKYDSVSCYLDMAE